MPDFSSKESSSTPRSRRQKRASSPAVAVPAGLETISFQLSQEQACALSTFVRELPFEWLQLTASDIESMWTLASALNALKQKLACVDTDEVSAAIKLP